MCFQLHPRLKQDCLDIGQFELCRLLLMNDNQYPWFILVPMVADITEIHQFNQEDSYRFIDESNYLAKNLATIFKADKMNIAALGNMVPQLHIHHIVRYRNDKTWPAPVWGLLDAIPYTQTELTDILEPLQQKMTRLNFHYQSAR